MIEDWAQNQALFKLISGAYADPAVQANASIRRLLWRYGQQMLSEPDYVAVTYRLDRALINYAALNPHRVPNAVRRLQTELDQQLTDFLARLH